MLHPHRNDYYNEAKAEHEKKISQLQAAKDQGYSFYREVSGELEFSWAWPLRINEKGVPETDTDYKHIDEGLKKQWG